MALSGDYTDPYEVSSLYQEYVGYVGNGQPDHLINPITPKSWSGGSQTHPSCSTTQPSPGKWDVGTAIGLHQLEQGKMCNCPKADAEKEVMCSHG